MNSEDDKPLTQRVIERNRRIEATKDLTLDQRIAIVAEVAGIDPEQWRHGTDMADRLQKGLEAKGYEPSYFSAAFAIWLTKARAERCRLKKAGKPKPS